MTSYQQIIGLALGWVLIAESKSLIATSKSDPHHPAPR